MMLEQEGKQPDVNAQEKLSPGGILRKAREAKKISLVDAANELRLSVARMTDLEENRFSEMGAITFAKGYLRSYARFLGVSEENVLQAFDEMSLGLDISTHKPSLMNEKMTENNSKTSRRMGYLVLLILALVVAFWWHNRESIAKTFTEVTSGKGKADAQAAATPGEPHQSEVIENNQSEVSSDNTNTYSLPVDGISPMNAPAQDNVEGVPAANETVSMSPANVHSMNAQGNNYEQY